MDSVEMWEDVPDGRAYDGTFLEEVRTEKAVARQRERMNRKTPKREISSVLKEIIGFSMLPQMRNLLKGSKGNCRGETSWNSRMTSRGVSVLE